MNYQEWSRRKFYGIMTGVFFAGAMVVSAGQPAQAEPKVEYRDREVVKEVKVDNREAFDRLNDLDQQIFTLSGEVIDAQGNALEVAGAILGNLETLTPADVDTATQMIAEETERITSATEQLEPLQAERAALIAN